MTESEPRPPEKPNREERYHHRHDEKEEEKTEEKDRSRNEKNWDEKWQRDPVNAVTWAAILIWTGICLLADTTKWGVHTFPTWWETWAVIMTGVGVIILLSMVVRFMMPVHRRHLTSGLIPGLIFLGIGLSWLNDWKLDLIWPVILIIIGVVIILGGIFRKRK
jgi:hypothetical protein